MSTPTPSNRRLSPQFWLMFVGLALSTTGTAMIWPFLMIYASQKLALPLAAITSLISITSAAGLISSVIAGSLVDRFGRKGVMTLGLFGAALVYLGYVPAASYWQFAILLALSGIFGPLFKVGADAMVADMFTPEERARAFAMVRMARNIGVALGPILGGLVVAISYQLGMVAASVALGSFGLITLFFLRETAPLLREKPAEGLKAQLRVFREALANPLFARMMSSFILMDICATLMWSFLAVFLKTYYGIAESRYSLIATTNALMVVFLQVVVTQRTRKFPPTRVMPVGAAFYAAAMLLVALSRDFWGFWFGMVVMTMGELITAPTASVFVANLAPLEKRGRYLGLFGLTWNMAMAVGPVSAGFLLDRVNIRAPWFFAALVGLISVLSFLALDRAARRAQSEQPAATFQP